MSATRIDAVLVRLGAVFLVVLAFRSLGEYSIYVFGGPEFRGAMVLAIAIGFFVPMVIAGLLWLFPNRVVGSLAPMQRLDQNAVTPECLMLIGVCLIGLYTIVFGFIDLLGFEAYRISTMYAADKEGFPEPSISPGQIAGRVVNIGQLFIGVVLILGRRQIARALYRLRRAGTSAS